MSNVMRSNARAGDPFPATARLRAEILIAPDSENLVVLFADALAEYGIPGHFCLKKNGAGFVPLIGDDPNLIACVDQCIVVETDESFMGGTLVLLAPPEVPLSYEHGVKLRGFAELYAARAIALQELADDVETQCGLTLRERYVLGRRLAGMPPVDIGIECGLSVATIGILAESAVGKLGCSTLAEAIALAARHGWLAVTSLENCSSSSGELTYKATRNG